VRGFSHDSGILCVCMCIRNSPQSVDYVIYPQRGAPDGHGFRDNSGLILICICTRNLSQSVDYCNSPTKRSS